MGPEVREFEQKLGAYVGVDHAIACANGTDAIQLALMALDIGPGDAVLVPSFTFTATAEPVALLGATPVFVDVDLSTFNLCPISLRREIDTLRHHSDLDPKAIIAVDLFGLSADFDAIGAVAEDYDLVVIEDAAQSIGGKYHGKPCGSFGKIATTSFFPSKPLGCYGDGGAVFTSETGIADRIRSLQVHGKGETKYENIAVGINSRLDSIQAAVLLEKLEVLDEEIAMRDQIAARYRDALGDAVGVQSISVDAVCAWAQFSVTVDIDLRDKIVAMLGQQGVPTSIYYPTPLHKSVAFENYATGGDDACPNAVNLSNRIFSLPMSPYLRESDQEQVCSTLINALNIGEADVS